jgi:hypothetical protein
MDECIDNVARCSCQGAVITAAAQLSSGPAVYGRLGGNRTAQGVPSRRPDTVVRCDPRPGS